MQHFPTVLPISPSSVLWLSQGRYLPYTISANHTIVDNPQAMVCLSFTEGWGLRPTHIQEGQVYLLIHSCMLSSITLTQEGSKTFVMFAFHVSSIWRMWNNLSLYAGTFLSVYDRLRMISSKSVEGNVFSEPTWCSLKHFHLHVWPPHAPVRNPFKAGYIKSTTNKS